MPRRAKKERRLSRCSYCGGEGHNRRTCPETAIDAAVLNKKNQRWKEYVLSSLAKHGIGPGALISRPGREYFPDAPLGERWGKMRKEELYMVLGFNLSPPGINSPYWYRHPFSILDKDAPVLRVVPARHLMDSRQHINIELPRRVVQVCDPTSAYFAEEGFKMLSPVRIDLDWLGADRALFAEWLSVDASWAQRFFRDKERQADLPDWHFGKNLWTRKLNEDSGKLQYGPVHSICDKTFRLGWC